MVFILSDGRYASCAISDEETGSVLITGGSIESKSIARVSRYNSNGWVEDISDLNEPRQAHACSSYLSQRGERVCPIFIVTFHSCVILL